MKKIISLLIGSVFASALPAASIAPGVFDEASFDGFQNVTITSSTPSNDRKIVPIENLFNGDSDGNDRDAAAIFTNVGVGNVAFVEFQTVTPVNLSAFKLALREDQQGELADRRGASAWTLYGNAQGRNFGPKDVISTGGIDSEYAKTYQDRSIVVTEADLSTTAQFFRLELTQAHRKGIRVMELGARAKAIAPLTSAASISEAVSGTGLNVLMIVIDDLRTELGCYGVDAVHSPNIDRLAKKGMRFDHAYSQYAVCNPSRASFLSGLRPDETGIVSSTSFTPFRRLNPNLVALPQLFRENGYYTACVGKIFHQSLDRPESRFEDPQSWDYFSSAHGQVSELGKLGEGRNLTGGKIGWARWQAAEGDDIDQPDGLNSVELLKVMNERPDAPFFIGYGIHKPHDPFIAPKKYFELYPEGSTPLAELPEDRIERLEVALPNNRAFADFTDQERMEFKRAYHACISFADAQVGKIMDTLDRLDLWDDTIVILMGDHGYHLGEHEWWNKLTVFENSSRAPMLIWVPGADGMGKSTESIVEFVDIYPTLADYGGLEPPHELSGLSMRPVLEDPDVEIKQAAYTQVNRPDVIGRSVRTPQWRYTEWNDGSLGVELYDHSNDSGEYYNLSNNSEYSSILKSMESLLTEGFSSH